MIECVDLTKHYGASRGVIDLTFSAQPGEILGFLGPNGAGKTTTIKLLTGYFPPTSGSAKVAGFDVAKEPLAARASIGYLPENAPGYPNMTVEGYVDFMLSLKRPGWSGRKRREDVAKALEAVHLTERRKQRLAGLSKGLRQRAGLAQAIAGDPSVVILDEPTAGLDPEQVQSARELVRGLADAGKAVMLSTHVLAEVETLADQVVILHEGRLVASGKPDDLRGGAGAGYELVLASDESAKKAWGALKGALDAKKGGAPWALDGKEARREGMLVAPLAWRGEGDPDAAPLADACREAGARMVELRRRRVRLEDVFLKAIAKGRGEPGAN